MSPNQSKNLRPPWKPGESGNPKGRPKGPSLTAALRELIESRNLQPLIVSTFLGAALGDKKLLGDREPNYAFFKELLDRLDGPLDGLPQHTGEVTIRVEYDGDGPPDHGDDDGDAPEAPRGPEGHPPEDEAV